MSDLRMNGSALTNILGGSPGALALRLVVVSFVVGLILATFGFEPSDIIDSFVRLCRGIVDFGFSDVRKIGRILATGALVVVPVWVLLRLLDMRRGR